MPKANQMTMSFGKSINITIFMVFKSSRKERQVKEFFEN